MLRVNLSIRQWLSASTAYVQMWDVHPELKAAWRSHLDTSENELDALRRDHNTLENIFSLRALEIILNAGDGMSHGDLLREIQRYKSEVTKLSDDSTLRNLRNHTHAFRRLQLLTEFDLDTWEKERIAFLKERGTPVDLDEEIVEIRRIKASASKGKEEGKGIELCATRYLRELVFRLGRLP